MKMGKNNKKGGTKAKGNVFKVAGAKSLKKSKAKAVNLGLKNIKQQVKDIDAQFLDINKTRETSQVPSKKVKPASKPQKKVATKEDVAKTVDQIVKMDI